MAKGLVTNNQTQRVPAGPNAKQQQDYDITKALIGTNAANQQGYAQPGNQTQTAGYNNYDSRQQSGPFRGNLTSNFNFNSGDAYTTGQSRAAMFDSDSDVKNAARIKQELDQPNEGTNSAELQALLNMYQGRIGQKNALSEQIAGSDQALKEQEGLLTSQAGQALGEGTKHTRENYNSRGLLYSGLRQGGEQQVKQGVAAGLDQSISGARREGKNAKNAAQNAYAAVGLANQQESLELAHSAFDTASRNSIARMQAMQQLGSGVGAVAGAYFGSRSNGGGTNPTSDWQPQQLTMPEMGHR